MSQTTVESQYFSTIKKRMT